uniref:Cadherin domain-containing protein n=1 Tax=Anisakis simplex TaxID=6269 RepID=A0A0M3KKK3_ANISI
LVSAGGFEDAFSINPDNGIITLERSIEPSGNSEQILLTVEARDQDEPSLASEAIVVINVEDERIPSTSQTTPEPFDVPSAKNALRFSSRSYT